MLHVGRRNTLKISEIDHDGAHFQTPQGDVLLPSRELSAGSKVGDRLEVFVYHGSAGKLSATLRTPLAQVGEFALLKVAQLSTVGAFLDWGLDKDLLVPFSEQTERMQLGRKYLVKLCLDNMGRIVGTARIDQCLEPGAGDLKNGDQVNLMIWAFTDLGVKVIINDLYSGLIYRDELRSGQQRGSRLVGFIKHVREDGKIDVTLRRVGAEGVEEAKQAILAALAKTGELHLNDQSSPEAIREALAMSKKSFKKAVGGLYKDKRIELTEAGIRLRDK
ncbi:CvfB family protein [Trichloromonas sp.]|uniref:CvfB family protein n=1 Tax=Trichloromonas sp. TaxID=3069249 RepID=UPI003D8165B4